MNKYDPPKDEEMFLGHFSNKLKKRIKKSLMEFIFFKNSGSENGKIFVNYDLLSDSGKLCSMADAITLLRYDNKKSPLFIDSQWIIDEKIGGIEFYTEIERLIKETRSNERLWKEEKEVE